MESQWFWLHAAFAGDGKRRAGIIRTLTTPQRRRGQRIRAFRAGQSVIVRFVTGDAPIAVITQLRRHSRLAAGAGGGGLSRFGINVIGNIQIGEIREARTSFEDIFACIDFGPRSGFWPNRSLGSAMSDIC